MVVGESRLELLEWLNATLDLNYTRVEECGTGAAFCQLMDCTVGGVPMSKVKFDSTYDYDNRQNWKVLQAMFTKRNITKVIDVERLIKCRLQDNLELLQWFKRFWMDNKGYNDDYDAVARRRGQSVSGSTTPRTTPRAVSGSRVSSGSSVNSTPALSTSRSTSRTSMTTNSTPFAATRRSIVSPNNTQPSSRRVSSYGRTTPAPAQASAPGPVAVTPKVDQLTKELTSARSDVSLLQEEVKEYKLSSETLETERNFYFNKLREIEILIQNIDDLIDTNNFAELKDLTVVDLTKKIQTILYSTEEGFQTTHDFEDHPAPNGISDINDRNDTSDINDVNGENSGEANMSMTEGDGYYSDGDNESF